MTVDVSVENGETNAYSIVPSYEMKLQDENGYSYISTYTGKDPIFNTYTIQSGRKSRGYLTFEVPTISSKYELVYTLSFWSNKQIIVKLENKS